MITGIDHVVLTVRDVEAAAAFYARVLGLEVLRFGEGRVAVKAGAQKINFQHPGEETRNHAAIGAGDVCLLTHMAPAEVIAGLESAGVHVAEGPVTRAGALGPLTSVYFTDPDGNLIEVASYGGGG